MSEKFEKYEKLFGKIDESKSPKEKAFDEIAKLYYAQNFGTAPKGEIDLLLFSLFFDKMPDDERDDYQLSKLLGITQSRVLSLRMRKELKYPYLGDKWKEKFADLLNNAVIDETKTKMRINILDKNVYIEVKHRIDKMGSFVDTHLNPNLLQIRVSDFINLIDVVIDDNQANLWKEKLTESIEAIKNIKQYEQCSIGEIIKKSKTEMKIEEWREKIRNFAKTIPESAANTVLSIYLQKYLML